MSDTAPNFREGNGSPLYYSCLENPMDRGACYAVVRGVAKSRTLLSDFTFTFLFNALEKDPEPGSQRRLLSPAPDELVGPGHLCFGQALHDSDAAPYGNHRLGRSTDGLERVHAP